MVSNLLHFCNGQINKIDVCIKFVRRRNQVRWVLIPRTKLSMACKKSIKGTDPLALCVGFVRGETALLAGEVTVWYAQIKRIKLWKEIIKRFVCKSESQLPFLLLKDIEAPAAAPSQSNTTQGMNIKPIFMGETIEIEVLDLYFRPDWSASSEFFYPHNDMLCITEILIDNSFDWNILLTVSIHFIQSHASVAEFVVYGKRTPCDAN